MSGPRQMIDVFRSLPGSCEIISEQMTRERVSNSERCIIDKQSLLARAIEVEIIPRLMLAHRQSPGSRQRTSTAPRDISEEEIREFTRICVQHDATVAQAYVEALLEQGTSADRIFTVLFAAAARRFGELWESDNYSFAEVTIGLSRIQQLIHIFSPFFEGEREVRPTAASALLIPMPGEQHSLGLLLVEEFFRRSGWSVWTPHGVGEKQLMAIVRQERFDMVGISVTCDVDVDVLASLVKSIRAASHNREVLIMLGGRVINERPDYVTLAGADSTDVDGSQAVQRIELLTKRVRSE